MTNIVSNRISARESGMELLRILAILFVTCHHFLLFGVYGGKAGGNDVGFWLLNSFIYIGVNCFILISGYFGIRAKVKGFLNLYLIIAFYSLLCFTCNCLLDTCDFNVKSVIINAFFCISHKGDWFIQGYVVLFLSAPLINRALEKIDRGGYLIILLLYTVMNEYFGYFWKTPSFNIDGFNASQFIYLYLIGGYMRRYLSRDWIDKRRSVFMISYIVCSALYGGMVFLDGIHRVPHWDPWKYNNPLLIASSISFFLFFASFHFKSKAVNTIGASTFAIFLAQGGVRNLYKHIGELYLNVSDKIGYNSILVKLFYILIVGILFSICVIIFDQLRILLFKPIWKAYDAVEEKVKHRFSNG